MQVCTFHILPGLGSVALETIHADACKRMAGLAELPRCIDRDELALLIFISVTGNAINQAVVLGAYALMHGFIALMHQELHMASAHHVGVFHTSLQFYRFGVAGLFPIRMDLIVVRNGGQNTPCGA